MKVRKEILIEPEQAEEIKKLELNLSDFVRSALETHFSKSKTLSMLNIMKSLAYKIKDAQQVMDRMKSQYKSLCREREEFIEEFSRIPEIQGFTSTQLNDYTFLENMAVMIRKKYNNRISITQIQEYYELKDQKIEEWLD